MNSNRMRSKFRHPYPRFKVFTPEMVREIIEHFGESLPDFARRFFLSVETIKNWVSRGKRHVCPVGPAVVVLLELEKIMIAEKAERQIARGWGGRLLTDYEELEAMGQKRLCN